MIFTIIFAALASIVAAQGMSGLPECAWEQQKACVTHSIPTTCGMDVACICKSGSFLSSIACCIAEKCSEDDQDTTLSAANSICAGGGVTDLPESVICSVTVAITTVTPTSTLDTLTTFTGTSTQQTTMETAMTKRTTEEKTDTITEPLTTITQMTTKVNTSATTEAVTTQHSTTTSALTIATSVVTSKLVSGSSASATSTATGDASLGMGKDSPLMAFAGAFALLAFLV
ncbi:hypothetical protein N7495_006068 [Penicillium taxi]|uniref:uncharacterized protein n=1 Tax=Penicillium taxi TaxID=168475 RepID=UPI002544E587|nr:uncharacterized protein N7495_006068 [Penicillium taxi]KAJ5894377.1 hypothetical protein N7495_006068 [Penicillium taxi]